MSFRDTLKADLAIFYDSASGFAVDIVYTPQSGSSRTIPAIVEEEIDPEFETATADLDYDVMRIRLRADNDTTGVITVKEQGRGAQAGDRLTLDGDTWRVKKKMTRGVAAGTDEHVLVCSTSDAPLPDFFG